MVTSSLSARRGAGPGRFKACWITAAPFIVSSTMVKMVVRTVALSSIGSALLVCLCWLQTVAYYRSHSLSAISTKRLCVRVWEPSLPLLLWFLGERASHVLFALLRPLLLLVLPGCAILAEHLLVQGTASARVPLHLCNQGANNLESFWVLL